MSPDSSGDISIKAEYFGKQLTYGWASSPLRIGATGGVNMRQQQASKYNVTASRGRFFFRAAGRNLILALAILGMAACADQSLGRPEASDEKAEVANSTASSLVSRPQRPGEELIAAEIGISVQSIHLTSAGYVLDMRYKVLDIEKAKAMVGRQAKPYVVVQKSGLKLAVPVSYKLGPLRQSTTHPEDNRIYFTFFANPGRHVESGDVIRLVVGDYTTDAIVVL